jgi:nucleoside 2-deoxyribosyltransferase
VETITISASLRFKKQVETAINDLKEIGVEALFPNLDGKIIKAKVTVNLMRQLTQEHFEAIDASEALYIICPNGYVGTLVSVEIGYACAHGKPIIFSEKPKDIGLRSFATGYVGLEELGKLKTLSFD